VNKQLTETLGIDLKLSTPEALQQWTVAEMDRWAKVIKENGIKPD
jgi:tripartite-type tricarboxylate transporter receptor subunit TctC